MVVECRRLLPGAALLLAIVSTGCSENDLGQGTEDATDKGPRAWCTELATKPSKPSAACAAEKAVANRLEALRDQPDELEALLLAMPKGGDLHSHLSGAVATERLIDWAVEDALCVDGTLTAGSCKIAGSKKVGAVPRADLVAAWSMEGFQGTVDEGHDHFFEAFAKFRVVTQAHGADMLASVSDAAAAQGVGYLELMLPLGVSGAGKVAASSLPVDAPAWDQAFLSKHRTGLLASSKFRSNLDLARKSVAELLEGRAALLSCGGAGERPGCGVEVRLLVQVARDATRENVFGQMLHAFELAAAEPRVVGLNLALAEDGAASLAGYEDHMRALEYLRGEYGDDGARVALHAGELVPELLPDTPEGQQHLTFHVRQAVLVGGAERIGHGIDVLREEGDGMTPTELLAEMAERQVLLEACLSSNHWILGVAGDDHPMASYLDAGVPVALATDDEGVSRSSMTGEMIRAVLDQGVSYPELKAMVRRSLEHAFLPGESLWKTRGAFRLRDECKSTASKTCKAAVLASERAGLQWRLEDALAAFEKKIAAGPTP